MKLWQTKHPYYGPDGSDHEEFRSWVDFFVEWGDVDLD